LKAYVSTWRS
ncbi:cache domain protein, partial [Vibrio parahaemolyticus VPTS-2010_2]